MDSELLNFSLSILKYLGVTSVVGFIGSYVAWITFFPEIVVESVVNKSRDFNYTSKLKIKNNGKIPAIKIQADTSNFCASFNTNTMNDCGSFNGPAVASKLSGGESSEISVSPGFQFGGNIKLDSCSFALKLKYEAKLFWFKRSLEKNWLVELENFPNGEFNWVVKII